jgi:transposase
MRALSREKAFALYVGGRSQRQIVTELKISKSSISRWSKSDKWVKRREDSRLQIIAEIQQKNTSIETQRVSVHSHCIESLLRQALAELEAYHQGLITRKQIKFSISDIHRLTKLLAETQIIKPSGGL